MTLGEIIIIIAITILIYCIGWAFGRLSIIRKQNLKAKIVKSPQDVVEYDELNNVCKPR